jgi:hypothetical protein
MKRSVLLGCGATAALAVVVGVSACGATTTAPPSHTSSPAPSAHTSSPAPSATAGAADSIKGIPFYRPSTVRSKTETSATLTSADPVTKVTDYYVSAVNAGGWTTVSKSTSAYHGNLTIKKAGQGATISVAPSGSGSLVTISTYPVA